MNLDLDGKVALVGGGSRGIGLAIAKALAAEGCKVVLAARDRQGLDAAVVEVGESAHGEVADLTNPADCERLVAAVQARFGRLDVLVANAGSGASVAPGRETPEEWRRVIELNLFTATNLIGAARPLLAQDGGGAVVCISSICGREALGAPVTYSAAKAALDATVNGLSRPFAAEGVRINGVAPGNILFPGGTWDRKLGRERRSRRRHAGPRRTARRAGATRGRGERRDLPGLAARRLHHGRGAGGRRWPDPHVRTLR
jgi:3-oxoacyl-[acyl-carrier protein] reductase